ncbi:MAG: hypothetical protein CR997_07755 [Acidobacteria bacterium]|nr:MAG: hypothetical protein CR997_07755 [Acidobacteriota bacterium]
MSRKHFRILAFRQLIFVLPLLAGIPSFSGEPKRTLPNWLEVSGHLDTIHSIRTKPPHDKITSRARIRLETRADFKWLYLYCSLDGEKNWTIAKETGTDIRECWVEHVDDTWDMRMGRQIIIWGQADGVQITDVISPPDFTESLTREMDEIRMPVDAARFRYLGNTFTSELILVPVFREAVYPEGDNPWAVSQHAEYQNGIVFLPADTPDTSFENTEVAFRMSGYFSGLDVAASVFYSWDDTPVLHPVVDAPNHDDSLILSPRHHRVTIYGLAFSRPWSDFVFRGETAFYRGQRLACDSLTLEPLVKNLVKWLAGVDWTPGHDWTLTAQLVGESILNHEPVLSAPANRFLCTLNVSKKLMNERLTLSNMIYIDCEDSGLYDRIKTDYEVSDGFHLSAGLDIFQGHKGLFKAYENNSQFWIKAKYNY